MSIELYNLAKPLDFNKPGGFRCPNELWDVILPILDHYLKFDPDTYQDLRGSNGVEVTASQTKVLASLLPDFVSGLQDLCNFVAESQEKGFAVL